MCTLDWREIVVLVCSCCYEVVTHMFLTLGRYLMYALGKYQTMADLKQTEPSPEDDAYFY